MQLPIFIVDAFSSVPFSGNPAAVCLLGPGVVLSDETRQKIAAEMNLSETAFVEPMPLQGPGDSQAAAPAGVAEAAGAAPDPFATASHFRLRWFTPTCEVPCCGHATVASAAVLYQARSNPSPSITFHTLSGEMTVSRTAPKPSTPTPTPPATPPPASSSSSAGPSAAAPAAPLLLSLTLPAYPPDDPVPAAAADPTGPLAAACCGALPVAEVRYAGRGGLNYVLMVLADGVGAAQLAALQPDFGAMAAAAAGGQVQGVIVCAREGQAQQQQQQGQGDPWRATPEPASAPGPAVVSRFFAPWMGINEDPVTGSAHAVLGPYWEPRLRGPGAEGPGEPAGPGVGAGIGVGQGGASGPMRMRQCSARGGDLLVEVLRPEGPGDVKVRVSGAATLVMSGTMVV